MLRLPIQLVRHRRVTTLLFRSPGETDGYALLIAFNATLFAPVSRLDATVPSTGKWVVREASCLPKININSKWIALLPILTPRLRNSEQAFRVRRRALRIIDSIWVVLNSVGSLWVTGLNLTSDPLPDDHYWIDSGLGQMYQLSPER
jgi:hypothetical protein